MVYRILQTSQGLPRGLRLAGLLLDCLKFLSSPSVIIGFGMHSLHQALTAVFKASRFEMLSAILLGKLFSCRLRCQEIGRCRVTASPYTPISNTPGLSLRPMCQSRTLQGATVGPSLSQKHGCKAGARTSLSRGCSQFRILQRFSGAMGHHSRQPVRKIALQISRALGQTWKMA